MLSHLRVSTKLVGVIGIVMVAASAAVAWFVFRSAERGLRSQVEAQLAAERNSRARLVSAYFQRFDDNLRLATKLLVTQFALRDMPAAIRSLPQQLRRTAEPGSADDQRLRAYYEADVHASMVRGGLAWRGVEHYLPGSAPLRLLQSAYVAANPHPAKSQLSSLGLRADYGRLHAMIHPVACGWVATFALPDVLLVAVDGTVLYSCSKRIDLATNLRTGPFQNSGLAEAFRRAVSMPADTTALVDYQPYEPIFGAPASFGAAPVFDTTTRALLGVLVFEVGIHEINSTMTDASGFGGSGESYLLGPDLVMRTDSRFVADSTILKRAVQTPAGRRALAGESGTMEQDDYRGVRVLAAYAPIDVATMRWAIVAEIDLAEALAPARLFQTTLAWVLAIVGLVGGFVMWEALRRIVLSPVAALAAGARRVAARDYSQPVGLTGRDELGQLAQSFDGMMASIGSQVDELRRAQAALVAAEDERQRVLTAAGVGLWRGDLASQVWRMDARARAMLGLNKNAVVNMQSWTSALHPDDRARAVATLQEVKRAAAPYQLEYRVVWPDGHVRHLLERGLSSGPPGQPATHIDGIFYDITALRFAERRAEQLLEAAPDGMVVVDAEGRVVLVNAAAERLFGYARSELIARSITTLLPDSPRPPELGDSALQGQAREVWGRRQDGTRVPIEVRLSPLEAADGRLLVAVMRDISERRAAEHSLRESEERLAAAAQGAHLGLWDVDPQDRQVVVNALFESQLGYAPLTLRESDEKWSRLRGGLAAWIALVHPDDRERIDRLIEMFLAGGPESYRAEQRVRRGDGTYTWILSVGNSVSRDEQGRPMRVNGVHMDISGMKALQGDLQQRLEELQRLQSLRDGLVHMIVHDLRSPLTSVMGFLDLIRSDPSVTDLERTRFIAAAYDGGSQMAEMISSLLDINRLEAGEMPVDLQPVNICEVTADAMRSLGGLVVGRHVVHETPHGVIAAICDPALIRRVVGNLLGNALKFTPADGAITVSVTQVDGQPRVEVADTGPGIPADFIPRAFDKFSQGSEGRAGKRYSTGLGLTFCKLAVEAHGGTIGVTSEVGVGSRFWFDLPAPRQG